MYLPALHPGISNLQLSPYDVSKSEDTAPAALRAAWMGVNIFFILPVQKLRLRDGKSTVLLLRPNTWWDREWPHLYLTQSLWLFLLSFCAKVSSSVLPPSCVSSRVPPTVIAVRIKGNSVLLVGSTRPSMEGYCSNPMVSRNGWIWTLSMERKWCHMLEAVGAHGPLSNWCC